ncbi:adenosylcobinamide amidohydrolase [Paenochrobactrum sp. BZR 588]|uniref:adenosylcobinamide amidohydrolase n=1 Tax=unclassified Paenochrobactrum TaxID=2639760 RepID=UPI003853CFEA
MIDMNINCERPWLTVDLGHSHQVLSWTLNAPGFVETDRIVWREVRNSDLTPELDAHQWLLQELQRTGNKNAVAFLTSRNIDFHHYAEACVESEKVSCLVTAGLSNAERVGTRHGPQSRFGTINILVKTSSTLSEAAMIELMSVVVQARTLAVLETDIKIGNQQLKATGTGTDCVAIASPLGNLSSHCFHAGLHTAIAEAAGAAVLSAMYEALDVWKKNHLK